MKALFLDTATQVTRHWHGDSERGEVRRQLSGRKLYCSEYVKCQYRATILRAIVYLHNLFMHFGDMRRALREAKDYRNAGIAHGSLSPATQRRIIEIGLWMLEHRGSYDEQRTRLEDLIEDGWEIMFDAGLTDGLVDETKCVYANADPRKGMSGAYEPFEVTCRKDSPKRCQIEDFWANHREEVRRLAALNVKIVKARPKDVKELGRVREHAAKIHKGESPYGERCTVHLSDAIICIESKHCPEKVAIHSTNKKHFRPLAEILQIDCEPAN